MSNTPYFFLLGGHDLEMLTIRALLEENGFVHGQDFLDKNLAWGASWNDYSDEITELRMDRENIQIVGIELAHKDKMPPDAIDIDHHNERSHEKSSLAQVADLLNITLSQKQKLIAANDCAYIPGLLALGASKEEINAILLADRQAQGVTTQDEELAQQSIASAKWVGDVCIVQSLTDKFSPITDNLYGQAPKLLIFTNSQLSYYGIGKQKLAKEFEELIKDDKAYHGGTQSGFFGLVDNAFSKEELKNFKKKIIDMVTQPFSKHIFLFPFSWRTDDKTANISSIDRSIQSDKSWKRDIYKIKDATTFNESVYFYDFVKEALYDYGGDDNLLRHYEYQLGDAPTYTIDIQGENAPIVLDVSDIILNLYTTGVGILSFHFHNTKKEQSSFDKILKINEFGRRVFPQFLDIETGIQGTKGAFLAEKITLNIGNKTITDDLAEAYPPKSGYSERINLSRIILDILPQGLNASKSIKPILDDRMFVICWYGNDELINDLSTFNEEKERYNYTQSDEWYQMLFVDKGELTVQNHQMQKVLLEKHSYARWIEQQQLFGITRYSFMALTKGTEPWLIPSHVTTIYYKMIELAIAQRISALNFAQKATEIAKFKGDTKDVSTKVNDLFKAYIQFQNCLYFREVTAQEQGIEMYNMMQDILRTERDVKELDQELDELNQYANMLEERKQTKAANLFALIATIFLPASLIAGILGMNTMPSPIADYLFNGNFHPPFITSIVLMGIFTGLAVYLYKRTFKQKQK